MSSNVTMQEFTAMKSNEMAIIDVREADEYAAGHIPGAQNYPLSLIEKGDIILNQDETYYVVCKAGLRSKKAAAILTHNGYTTIDVEGGTEAWEGPLEQ